MVFGSTALTHCADHESRRASASEDDLPAAIAWATRSQVRNIADNGSMRWISPFCVLRADGTIHCQIAYQAVDGLCRSDSNECSHAGLRWLLWPVLS